jgi:hypothetical protein
MPVEDSWVLAVVATPLPDGVASVTLDQFRLGVSRRELGLNVGNVRAPAAIVHNNIALIHLGALRAVKHGLTAVEGVPVTARMT